LNYSTADRLLREVHYKPEYNLTWRRSWGVSWDRQGTRDSIIEVEIEAFLPNSSDYPNYLRKSYAGGRFQIDLDRIGEKDHETFYRIVLNNLIAWETHEAREFFRVGSQYIAPFHPHRPDGEGLWVRTAGPQPAERLAAA